MNVYLNRKHPLSNSQMPEHFKFHHYEYMIRLFDSMRSDDRPALLLGCSVVLLIFSSILVILRLISRQLSKAKLWWDDALIVLSLVSMRS